jgi:FAD/FMN-containing dehydrogenase
MSVTKIDTTSQLPAASELRAMMQGRVVLRGDGDYARTRQIWNGAVENQPSLIAVCETSADVQAAVRVARRNNLPFSVRGGGHDWAGRALCADGLVIDLTRMREVVVDMQSRELQEALVTRTWPPPRAPTAWLRRWVTVARLGWPA